MHALLGEKKNDNYMKKQKTGDTLIIFLFLSRNTVCDGSSLLRDPEVKAPNSLKELWYILQAPKGFIMCKFPLALMRVIIDDSYFKDNKIKFGFYFAHLE